MSACIFPPESIGQFRITEQLLAGIPVYTNENIQVGRGISGNFGAGLVVLLHPLDVIAITYGNDLHARADAALAWIVDRIERQARAAVRRIYELHPETEGSLDV